MGLVLPMLRADARLYRNYIYHPEPPFEFPIFAYSGKQDPNVREEHVEGWGRQTTGPFDRREFAGGHFFLQTNQTEFLTVLTRDLPGVIQA